MTHEPRKEERAILDDRRLAQEIVQASNELFALGPNEGEIIESKLGDSSVKVRYEVQLPPPLPNVLRLEDVFIANSPDFSCRLSFHSSAQDFQTPVPTENTLFILKKGELASAHFNFRVKDDEIIINSSVSSRPDVEHLPTVLMLLSHEMVRSAIHKYPAIFSGKRVISSIEDISWDKKRSYHSKSGWGSRRAEELGYKKQEDGTWMYLYQ